MFIFSISTAYCQSAGNMPDRRACTSGRNVYLFPALMTWQKKHFVFYTDEDFQAFLVKKLDDFSTTPLCCSIHCDHLKWVFLSVVLLVCCCERNEWYRLFLVSLDQLIGGKEQMDLCGFFLFLFFFYLSCKCLFNECFKVKIKVQLIL